MAHIQNVNAVGELVTVTGTGEYPAGTALTQHTTIASRLAVNDTMVYFARGVDGSGVPTGDVEWGLGTRTATGLARTTVRQSSNSDAAVNWPASSTVQVFMSAAAPYLPQFDNLNAITVPAAPSLPPASSADTLKIYARKIAGRMTPKYIGPSGVDQFIQDKISTNRTAIYFPNGGTTVGLNLGINWTTGGTVSHPTPSSTAPAIYNQQARTRWANIATTTNQTLGLHTVTAQKSFWRGNAAGLGGFNFHARFAIGLWPAATVRLFVGLSDQNTSPVASDTLAGNLCGLWHDTTMAASVLNFTTRNGTTATNAAITLAANLAAGQCFDFYMWSAPNGSAIFYRLDELNTGTTLVDTSTTTNIPLNTAFMGPTLQMSNGTANVTVTTTAFELMAFSCQSDN